MKRKGRKCSRHQSRDYAADHGESQGTADICTKATEHPIQRRWVFPDMNSSPWRTLFPWRTPGAGISLRRKECETETDHKPYFTTTLVLLMEVGKEVEGLAMKE